MCPKLVIKDFWFMCDPLLIYFLRTNACMVYVCNTECVSIYFERMDARVSSVSFSTVNNIVLRMPTSISNHNIAPMSTLYGHLNRGSLVNAIALIPIDKWKKMSKKNESPQKNHPKCVSVWAQRLVATGYRHRHHTEVASWERSVNEKIASIPISQIQIVRPFRHPKEKNDHRHRSLHTHTHLMCRMYICIESNPIFPFHLSFDQSPSAVCYVFMRRSTVAGDGCPQRASV